MRLLDVILELCGVHVGSRCGLFGLLNYLVLLMSHLLIGRGCSQAQFLTQVVFHLVEDVSQADPRIVRLRLGNSLNHYLGLHVDRSRCFWHNVWEKLHDVLTKHSYEVFRALEGEVCVIFHLLVSFFVYL